MAKERLYDLLTQEDFDRLGYYADLAYQLLSLRFGRWRRDFNPSKRAAQDARTVAWAHYQQTMEATGIPAEGLGGFESPGNPAARMRGKLLSEIYDEIFSPHLQGDEYVDACRKTSSIMSVRTAQERARKKADQEALEKLRANGAFPPKAARPRETSDERRERLLAIAKGGTGGQNDFGLAGTKIAVTETPIAVLPPQTTELARHEASREVTLVMPEIVADADHQQRLNNELYPKPTWMKNHRKRRKCYQH